MHKNTLIPCTILLAIATVFLLHGLHQDGSRLQQFRCRQPASGWRGLLGTCHTTAEDSCNWLRPGYLRLDLLHPLETTLDHLSSSTEGESCTSHLAMLRSLIDNGVESPHRPASRRPGVFSAADGEGMATSYGELSSGPDARDLAGKRVLIIGDSIDRVLLEYLERTVDTAHYSVYTLVPPKPFQLTDLTTMPSWLPRTLSFPASAEFSADPMARGAPSSIPFAIDFVHFYGLDEGNIWEDKGSGKEGNGPATMTARLTAVADLWGEKEYDVVIVGSGLWDLARYQRTRYLEKGVDDLVGLPTDWLEEWKHDAKGLISMIRDEWPGARLAWRTLHEPRWGAGGWFLPANTGESHHMTPPFTPLRIHQLRQAQLALLNEEKLEEMPLGKVMARQEEDWLADDIHPGPAGNAVHAELLFDLVMHGPK